MSRIAIVTGGIGGLGTEICRHLARSGHVVVAADLAGDAARVRAFEDGMQGLPVRFAALDVTDFDACGAIVADVEREHGAVDVLVNAAGITRDGTLRKMSREQWDRVLRVNLDSVFHMCRHVAEGMATRGYGRIVNISSVNGQTGQFGQTNYAAAKAGMHGFTMALARELARKGVTVNSIAPGYIATSLVMAIPEDIREGIVERIPVGRLGEPADVARAVGFLCEEGSGYITGAMIPVNGGLFMGF